MQPRKSDRIASRDERSGVLAPDTSGMNFYRADPSLADLLRIHLPDALFRHIEPHLDRLGELAGGRNPGEFEPKPPGSAADFGRQDERRQVLETQAERPQLVAGAMLVLDLAAAPVAFGTRRVGLGIEQADAIRRRVGAPASNRFERGCVVRVGPG